MSSSLIFITCSSFEFTFIRFMIGSSTVKTSCMMKFLFVKPVHHMYDTFS